MILEKNIRFSQSALWTDQKKYYDSQGIKAWDEDVPFYITSNPFIARDYARMIIAFIQDWEKKRARQQACPENCEFTILELGTGTGQFSFYILKYLTLFQKKYRLEKIKIQYIMSDVTSNAFDFWKNHPGFKPYIESGMLDFCVYDLYHDKHLQLHLSKKTLSENSLQNPLIVVANYLFDSVATDIFTVTDEKLFESTVTVKTPDGNTKNKKVINLKKIKLDHKPVLIENAYYNNDYDKILFDYPKQLIDTHFQFPIASLECLNNLKKLSHNQLLLLSSDKGYSNLEELDQCDYPELDFHGSFSVMVNYHAIGEYFKMHQGDYAVQAFRENMITGVFATGFKIADYWRFELSVEDALDGFSATDYFLIYESVSNNQKNISLEEMSSYFNLSDWDPYLLEQVSDRFADLTEDADPEIIAYLSKNMHKMAEQFYYLPAATDVLLDIGLFYQNISDYEQALRYYEQSTHYFGESDVTLFNMAMCYHAMNKKQAALKLLERALVLNKNAKDVQQWIRSIKSHSQKEM